MSAKLASALNTALGTTAFVRGTNLGAFTATFDVTITYATVSMLPCRKAQPRPTGRRLRLRLRPSRAMIPARSAQTPLSLTP